MKIDLTEDQFGDIMKILDSSGDGKITFYEFKDYLRQISN